jgi:serine palmitoyltransferase
MGSLFSTQTPTEKNPLFESLVWIFHTLKGLNVPTIRDYIIHGPKYYKHWFQELLQESPQHVLIETGLICFIIWLLFIRKTVDPEKITKNNRLSKRDEEELIDTWRPEPFIPKLSSAAAEVSSSLQVVEKVKDNHMIVRGFSRPALNLVTYDFLGISQMKSVKDAASAALDKYGCGSCGPRGFYGTIDVHLRLEQEIANFMGTEEAIAYSDGSSAITSAVPAFSKKGDLLVVDEACSEPILSGSNLSRSTVHYFKHNDMQDLERILSNVNKEDQRLRRDPTQQRRFIVVEGLFRNTGNICPLPELVRLKEKYFYRLIVDEALSFGTYGATGKGVTEHFGVPVTDVDILTVSLDTTLASVGGVCVGTREVVDHQRLSGAGYCFSASTPPFLVSAAITALEELKSNSQLVSTLRDNCKIVFEGLSGLQGWRIVGDAPSPIIHLALHPVPENAADEVTVINEVVRGCMNNGVGVVSSHFAVVNSHAKSSRMPFTIRITVNAAVSKKEIKNAVTEISKVAVAAVKRL